MNYELESEGEWFLNDAVPRDLRERTKAFAVGIIQLYASLPRDTVSQVIGKQFLRSGTSVGANYREAFRARSRAEFAAKIGDCLKELEETSYWLELLPMEAVVNLQKHHDLMDETGQLLAIFTTTAIKVKDTGKKE